jgi:hypothetical protein
VREVVSEDLRLLRGSVGEESEAVSHPAANCIKVRLAATRDEWLDIVPMEVDGTHGLEESGWIESTPAICPAFDDCHPPNKSLRERSSAP